MVYVHGTRIAGTLVEQADPAGRRLKFLPWGRPENAVDLLDYAGALSPQDPSPPASRRLWADAFKGSLVAVGLIASIFVPLVGVLIPLAIGFAIANTMAFGTNARPGIGGAVVAWLPGATFLILLNAASWAWALGAAAGLGAVGGLLLLPALRGGDTLQDAATAGNPWWARYGQSPH